MTQNRQPPGVSTGGQYAAGGKDRATVTLDDDEAPSGPCILTGKPGEDPDDCTTHDHEPPDTVSVSGEPGPGATADPGYVAVADLVPGDMITFAGEPAWQVVDYPQPSGEDYLHLRIRNPDGGEPSTQTLHRAVAVVRHGHQPIVADQPITTALERAIDQRVEAERAMSRAAGVELARFTRSHFTAAAQIRLEWDTERPGPCLSEVLDAAGEVIYAPEHDSWEFSNEADELAAHLHMFEHDHRWPVTVALDDLPRVGEPSPDDAQPAGDPHTPPA